MQLVPVRSNAERREAGSQQANAEKAFISSFNTELAQVQRDALKALREVMAETADPSADDNARLDDDDLQTRAARFRRLSLRLRAATAILRVKPMADPTAASDAAPARSAPTTRPSGRISGAPEASTRATAAPQPSPAASTPLPQHTGVPQPRDSDAPHQRNGHAGSHAAQSPQRPPVTGP